MAEPLVLYSANTWLAYMIAERFYDGAHFVWSTPYFGPETVPSLQYAIPPSSSPGEIYRELFEAVNRGDRHSTKIRDNRFGILKGAKENEKAGIITIREAKEIAEIVAKAETLEFRPLLYVIPFHFVAKMVKEVPVKKRAHPFSVEFVIKQLPRKYFDIIEWKWR
jgi:hypothetical protein